MDHVIAYLVLHYNYVYLCLPIPSYYTIFENERGHVTFTVPEFNVRNIPLPSSRDHWSNDDCLESESENYICSVQYCVHQLCTVQCTCT